MCRFLPPRGGSPKVRPLELNRSQPIIRSSSVRKEAGRKEGMWKKEGRKQTKSREESPWAEFSTMGSQGRVFVGFAWGSAQR